MTGSPDPTVSPYVGLEPYDESHRDYFFGRKVDTELIVAQMFSTPLSVLYGPSGVGKSSILRAGVVPHLRTEPQTAVLYFRDWHGGFLPRLLARCRETIEALGLGVDADAGSSLDRLLAQAAREVGGPIFLVLDQFEEFFVYHGGEAEHPFDAELARVVNRRDVQANVLISLREDWVSRLDRFRLRIPNLLGNMLPVRRLTAADAETAIRGPLAVYQSRFPDRRVPGDAEPDLVRELIDRARPEAALTSDTAGTALPPTDQGRDEVETSFLQLVLTRLWEEECRLWQEEPGEGAPVLRLHTLNEKLGGADTVVREHVAREMRSLSAAERDAAAGMFRYLVTPTGVKIAHRPEDLAQYAGVDVALITPMLERLANARLLRRLDRPERYEVFHDVLARKLLDWQQRHVQEEALGEAHARWVATRPWAALRVVATGEAHLVSGPVASVGRSVSYWRNDVDLRFQFVSRIHMLLVRADDDQDYRALVYDMRSLNGTTVNAEPVLYGPPRPVNSGDVIVVAGVALRFETLAYPESDDLRARPDPVLSEEAPPDGWGILVDGASQALRSLTAPECVLILDDRANRLIVEENAAGRALVIRRDEAGHVRLLNRTDAPITCIQRQQYVVRPDDGADSEQEVVVGRGYRQSVLDAGEEAEVLATMAWQYGDVFFQIVWAEADDS